MVHDTITTQNGIVTKQEVIEDLQRTAQQVEGNLSLNYYREHGNYTIAKVFDSEHSFWSTWNEAKAAAGLSTISQYTGRPKKYSVERLKTELRRRKKQCPHPVMSSDWFEKNSDISVRTVIYTLSEDHSFVEAKKAAGIEEEYENLYRIWEEILLENTFTKIRSTEYKEMLPHYSTVHWANFLDWVDDRDTINLRKPRPNSYHGCKTIYVKPGDESRSYVDHMMDEWGDKLDSVYHHILVELVGSGRSPNCVVGAIKYMTEDKTQKEVAEEVGCTDYTIRACRDAILDAGYFPEKA